MGFFSRKKRPEGHHAATGQKFDKPKNAGERQKKDWDDKGMIALIGQEAYDKMGTYDENTGGGTPIPKGKELEDYPDEKVYRAANQEDADEFRKKNPDFEKNGGIIRLDDQPRNADGTFGYNAQNKKSLKYKSRGVTVIEFLRGYVAQWYEEGKGNGDLITSRDGRYLLAFDMTMEELVNKCRSYIREGYTGRLEALAGKGDIVKAGNTPEKEKRNKDIAKKKRDAILANREDMAYSANSPVGKKVEHWHDVDLKDAANGRTTPTDPRQDPRKMWRRLPSDVDGDNSKPTNKPVQHRQPKPATPATTQPTQPTQSKAPTNAELAKMSNGRYTEQEIAEARAEGRLRKNSKGELRIKKKEEPKSSAPAAAPAKQERKAINWNDSANEKKARNIMDKVNKDALKTGKTYTLDDVKKAAEEGRIQKRDGKLVIL